MCFFVFAADILKKCNVGDTECIKIAATVALNDLPDGNLI